MRPGRNRLAAGSWQLAVGALAIGALTACAHPPAPPPLPLVEWPDPPEDPILRWAGEFPDARFDPPPPSFLKRAFRAVVGLEDGPGDRRPELTRPFGVAARAGGFVVADADGPQVLEVGWLPPSVRRLECPAAPWQMPLGVAAELSGPVYVCDGGAGRVVRLEGESCRTIGEGRLERPSAAALLDGELYVTDPPRHQVVVFGPDGAERRRFGGHGSGAGELNFPTAIAALPDGTLAVVDALNFRASRYSAAGKPLESFGEPGDGDGAFARPKAIAAGAEGALFVSDAELDVVIAFSPAHSFRLAIGGPGTGPGRFTMPAGVAVGDGRLYVADSYNQRVQVFELLGGLR